MCIVFFEWFSFVLIVQKAVKKSKSTHEGSILSVHGGYDQQDTRVACLASAFILIQKKTFSIRIWIAGVVKKIMVGFGRSRRCNFRSLGKGFIQLIKNHSNKASGRLCILFCLGRMITNQFLSVIFSFLSKGSWISELISDYIPSPLSLSIRNIGFFSNLEG